MIFILIGAIIGIYHEVSRRYCVNCMTLEQCFFWKQKGGGTSAAGARRAPHRAPIVICMHTIIVITLHLRTGLFEVSNIE